ncbi:ribonuclease P protein component [Garciella nitratireducens DSM 15102]|uniref:Ribonuclease P protein component n=2 Tax=Garciella TaxID=218204 RepID=A0A1T4PD14_9FIRM|nr:ribonuclease P protein component [Garciella nitratireducens DSM 15102]
MIYRGTGGSINIMKYTYSLKKNQEFKKIYREGKSYVNGLLVIYYLPNQKNYNKLGLSVSKKVGNSVIRNRVKRRIRESYRLNEEKIKKGYDMVIISRVKANQADFQSIEKALIHLLKKVHLWEK